MNYNFNDSRNKTTRNNNLLLNKAGFIKKASITSNSISVYDMNEIKYNSKLKFKVEDFKKCFFNNNVQKTIRGLENKENSSMKNIINSSTNKNKLKEQFNFNEFNMTSRNKNLKNSLKNSQTKTNSKYKLISKSNNNSKKIIQINNFTKKRNVLSRNDSVLKIGILSAVNNQKKQIKSTKIKNFSKLFNVVLEHKNELVKTERNGSKI